MARIRTIKPEFFSHELLASKSAQARLLAIGLLTLADCEGRLRWVPMQVHAQVFPWEASVNIEVLLGELMDASYVVHYEAEGKRYVEVVNFKKHQRLSGKEAAYESRYPAPPKDLQKTNDFIDKTGEATGKHLDTSLGSGRNPLGTGEHRNLGTGEHRNIGIVPAAKVVSKKEYSDDFEDFWEAYPRIRREKKGDAFKSWKIALTKKPAEYLIQRAKDYASSDQGQSQFSRGPAVWLNSEMWEDAPEAWVTRQQAFFTPVKQREANMRAAGDSFVLGATE